MTRIEEYLCDGRTPTDDEIRECLQIALWNDCIVKLRWFFPYNGWHEMHINKTMTFKECKEKLPKVYGV